MSEDPYNTDAPEAEPLLPKDFHEGEEVVSTRAVTVAGSVIIEKGMSGIVITPDEETRSLGRILVEFERTVGGEVQAMRVSSRDICRKHSHEQLPDTGGKDTLQFASPMYFVDESDMEGGQASLPLDVIRIGTLQGRVAVNYYTEPVDANLETYDQVKGQLIFEDGEHTKTFNINVYDDGHWTSTVEFKVCLGTPQNCQLSGYVRTVRVKIINADAFPSDEYEEEVRDPEKIETIPNWHLFWEYCWLNFNESGVAAPTIAVIVLDTIKTVIMFVSLLVGIYIIDVLFARVNDQAEAKKQWLLPDQYQNMLLIASWYVFAVLVKYLCDFGVAFLDIQGISKLFLQKALMNVYLNYTAESRASVKAAHLDGAIKGSCEEIAEAYACLVAEVCNIIKMASLIVFLLKYQPNLFGIYIIVVLAMVVIGFCILRTEQLRDKQKNAGEYGETLNVVVEEATQRFPLVAAYSKRPALANMFYDSASKLQHANTHIAIVKLNNDQAAQILCACAVTFYFIMMAPEVFKFDGSLSLGIFLATVGVLNTSVSAILCSINSNLLEIIDCFGSLKEVSLYINLPLELRTRKRIKEQLEGVGKQKLQCIVGEDVANGKYKYDVLNIAAHDLSFQYADGTQVFNNVNLSLPQGQVYAVTGPHNAGRCTLANLLANKINPTSGVLYVPCHLRVVHVPQEPTILQASILDNLTLGLPLNHKPDLNRIYNILKLCGLDDLVTMCDRQLDGAKDVGDVSHHLYLEAFANGAWPSGLTRSTRVRFNLARALIADPHVLIFHNCFDNFMKDEAEKLIRVVLQHSRERGLFLPDETRSSRRPRTVIYTTYMHAHEACADAVLRIDPEKKTIIGPAAGAAKSVSCFGSKRA
jgi:ABC-type multidrug transport system fused ATPase/permease subunit